MLPNGLRSAVFVGQLHRVRAPIVSGMWQKLCVCGHDAADPGFLAGRHWICNLAHAISLAPGVVWLPVG